MFQTHTDNPCLQFEDKFNTYTYESHSIYFEEDPDN